MTASRVGSIIVVGVIVAVLGLSARLDPAALNPLVYVLTVGSWVSLVLFLRPTLKRPRIGALSERAFIAFTIAFLGTVSSVIVYNTDHDRILFDAQTAALLFREAIIAVLLIPTIWIVLYFSGKLGQAADRSAALERIEAQGERLEAAVTENTRISQGARNDAHEAAEAANNINARMLAQDAQINEQGRQIFEQGERAERRDADKGAP